MIFLPPKSIHTLPTAYRLLCLVAAALKIAVSIQVYDMVPNTIAPDLASVPAPYLVPYTTYFSQALYPVTPVPMLSPLDWVVISLAPEVAFVPPSVPVSFIPDPNIPTPTPLTDAAVARSGMQKGSVGMADTRTPEAYFAKKTGQIKF